MKVVIAVTHLLGTGHLSRAVTLARAFVAAGHQAIVLSGGRAAPQIDEDLVGFIQAPPLASDGVNFTRLLDGDGQEASAEYLQDRREMMVAAIRDEAPDVVITELFPFGRRVLSAEFLALLDAAKGLGRRPLILASIRDILAPPSKPAKAERAQEIILENYDGVLVHSDEAITRLETSWPVTEELQKMLHYTGFVAAAPAGPHPTAEGAGEVMVSAGGGSVGQDLFECAIAAARTSDVHWRLLVGGADRADRIEKLRDLAGALDITIEAVRPDFRQMLHGAAASVSMCGYNTALDLLQTGLPAVLVPFDDGGEVEQTLRAKALASLSGIEVLSAAESTADALSEAVDQVVASGHRSPAGLQMQGAAQSVRIVENLLEQRE